MAKKVHTCGVAQMDRTPSGILARFSKIYTWRCYIHYAGSNRNAANWMENDCFACVGAYYVRTVRQSKKSFTISNPIYSFSQLSVVSLSHSRGASFAFPMPRMPRMLSSSSAPTQTPGGQKKIKKEKRKSRSFPNSKSTSHIPATPVLFPVRYTPGDPFARSAITTWTFHPSPASTDLGGIKESTTISSIRQHHFSLRHVHHPRFPNTKASCQTPADLPRPGPCTNSRLSSMAARCLERVHNRIGYARFNGFAGDQATYTNTSLESNRSYRLRHRGGGAGERNGKAMPINDPKKSALKPDG
ncbi:hypothetical protein QBC46DRAFT_404086 [Diplogelasinospora grovesii]|uniref:Uncharacterized protein n=1 Tax=Diplogelasinospora grovesii TaxID=303347 RepID=A0AAN6NFM5_9PEZI|nr:hypothetical protein QBC46DRAFT_404086 [Diplogelasinospora grovesii]